ncbi:hypothetical protein PIB30_101585 [Stylosanthes scabra]|uniref:Uncharacterized protein n=1 Tax=Stylosanthes scabra TaxID=79078 RepID=A0ABU6VWN9_9FABA|nr:hypothetical protein [Stylosanthes scabra]
MYSMKPMTKGHDVRVEELIAYNIAIIAEAAQRRSKLSFSSTIFRLCKEAGVSMAEFRGIEYIPVARPITAKVMTTTRGRINNNNPPQDKNMEVEEEQWQYNDNDVENEFINHEEHEHQDEDFEEAYQDQHQEQQQGSRPATTIFPENE